MKTRILIFTTIILILGCFSACKEECKNLNRDNIIGQWKLLEASVSVNHSQPDITDYSEENIIFDFQKNNKLVVTGNIVDSLSLFNDFREGEHYYEYRKSDVCPPNEPGPNLFINAELGSWEGSYFCTALLYEETMAIIKMNWIENSSWSIKLIKLN